ncbi:hypothetical protein EVAR_37387_1 [Eumeta japonica]|uniref:Uncharacterized protein n=1 Tax=Eumeta variegata TaxID=151549 RepID=A0A4C1ZUP4_EUMVA|nr:hypothetical protein EVAR_37387_1 [Eumeta japonica]
MGVGAASISRLPPSSARARPVYGPAKPLGTGASNRFEKCYIGCRNSDVDHFWKPQTRGAGSDRIEIKWACSASASRRPSHGLGLLDDTSTSGTDGLTCSTRHGACNTIRLESITHRSIRPSSASNSPPRGPEERHSTAGLDRPM